MSATMTVKGLAAGHGTKALFEGLDLVVAPGDKIGLVGPNGAGKSTLLRTLAGELEAEEGSISLSPPTALVGYLPQETERREGETLRGFLGRRTGVAAAQARYDAATEAFGNGAPGADDEFSDALDHWLALGGADLDDRAAQVCLEVGLTLSLETEMKALSGGQAARAGLASLLLARYDLFLLDEPTNDLDLAGLDQLEAFVNGLRAGLIVVSHDREFLARTINRVVELDLHQHQINVYGGSYDSYLAERAIARDHARADYDEYAGKLDSLASRANTQRNWAAQGVRNARRKAGDDADKISRKFAANSSEKQAAKVRQSEKAIERLEKNAVEEPRKEWDLRMEIAAAPRSGSRTAVLRAAKVTRGDFVFGPVDLEIAWGDKVAITGPNGAGKSTLLAALLGRLELDEGTADLGTGVVVGEVDQARGLFEGNEPLVDVFQRAAAAQAAAANGRSDVDIAEIAPEEVRTLLAKYGLKGDHVIRPAATLSPGERTRAALALLQARGVNLLVLDEPTNHLDLPAIEQLESALDAYEGTLLLVTHDRRMLAAVSTTRRLHVEDGQVTALA